MVETWWVLWRPGNPDSRLSYLGSHWSLPSFAGKLPLQERSKLRSFFADYDLVPSLGGGRTDVEKLLAGGLGGISGVEISR